MEDKDLIGLNVDLQLTKIVSNCVVWEKNILIHCNLGHRFE